jgi:hypothetical protein
MAWCQNRAGLDEAAEVIHESFMTGGPSTPSFNRGIILFGEAPA